MDVNSMPIILDIVSMPIIMDIESMPIIMDIESMPQGQPLETPLHPKRIRVWQPTDLGSSVPVVPPTPANPTSTLNYGSEPSSDESDNEELAPAFIARAYRSVLETPIDAEEEPIAEPTAEPSTSTASTTPPPVALTATDQPWSFFDFNWKAIPSPPIPAKLRRESFSKINVGPTNPLVDPYDIFIAIWDRQIMEHITFETNRYAQQVATQLIANQILKPNSRISRWCDTTVDELYVYFAIIIAMGIVVKSRLEEYWGSKPDIFCTPGFSAHMSLHRFELLSKCLHFNNNDDMSALELDTHDAKLFKIEPVLTHLNMKFQEMYCLEQNIALDESLLMWKGWLDINQFIPNTVGIKTYEICESQTGYLWRFEIHAHKRSSPQQSEDPLKASIPALVLRLLHGLENKGHTVWMDNYYNSPALARRLKTLGFDCVGTLRTNRKFVPQVLHNITKGDMRQGEITGLTSGDVDVMVWRDNNRVAMISTYHGNTVSKNHNSTKPNLISDYNIMMGGVDKKDQMLAMYPVERKRTRIWYKKLFKRLLNISVLNGYIIHRKSTPSSSLSHRKFRISLVQSLLTQHSSFATSHAPELPFGDHLIHYVSKFPLEENRKQRRRRKCNICKKPVNTFCVGCDIVVCMEQCFVSLHRRTR